MGMRTDLSEQVRTKDKIEKNKFLALVVAEPVCAQSGSVARAPGRRVHLVRKRGGRHVLQGDRRFSVRTEYERESPAFQCRYFLGTQKVSLG